MRETSKLFPDSEPCQVIGGGKKTVASASTKRTVDRKVKQDGASSLKDLQKDANLESHSCEALPWPACKTSRDQPLPGWQNPQKYVIERKPKYL